MSLPRHWRGRASTGPRACRADSQRRRQFVGAGTGIAPLRVRVLERARRADYPVAHFFVGGHQPGDLDDLANLWQLAAHNPWLRLVPVIERDALAAWHTDPPPTALPGMPDPLVGAIGAVVTARGPWTRHRIQIAGSPPMIRDTSAALLAAGVPRSRIAHDRLMEASATIARNRSAGVARSNRRRIRGGGWSG